MASTTGGIAAVTGADDPVVLVVEDEANVAEVFTLWLDDDYEVRIADGGAAGLEALADDVDVVLLDRRMPGVSGDEVLDELRERGHAARVAMVTAVDPDLDILEMEFDDYLTKPVTRDEVRETVERLVTLNDYDERAAKHFALAQKLGAIEAEKPRVELEENEEYRKLRDELASLRAEIDDIIAGMDEHDSTLLFKGMEGGGD